VAETVTVAIPVLDGGDELCAVLDAVAAQVVDRDVEVLVCDSGSRDGSPERARERGATVFEIPRGTFSHGGTRDLLADRASGTHVAFLTQDAVPAGPGWLAALLGGFEVAGDVALTFGPYRPRPDASAPVARELCEWFASFSSDGEPRVDRLGEAERGVAATALLGPRAFFTDANGCVAKSAWRHVPFRAVPYAEDHRLAIDMLRAGYAKVFVPEAAVIHSHEYRPVERFRRSFDEWRGLREVYGFVEPLSVASLRRNVVGPVRAGARDGLAAGAGAARDHALRYGGALLGSRAERLPAGVRRRLSLEGRGSFVPSDALSTPEPRAQP
jgi:GT2 family glycosyltransferase